MHISRWTVLPLAICFVDCALANSILLTDVDNELAAECAPYAPTFTACVDALRFHGMGKDDDALLILSASQTPIVRNHYKAGSAWPKDAFWKEVASAGAPPIDCLKALTPFLEAQFALDSTSISQAASDYPKSVYTALADLLNAVPPAPPGPPPVPPRNVSIANAYRYCFITPDVLFHQVKLTLQPR